MPSAHHEDSKRPFEAARQRALAAQVSAKHCLAKHCLGLLLRTYAIWPLSSEARLTEAEVRRFPRPDGYLVYLAEAAGGEPSQTTLRRQAPCVYPLRAHDRRGRFGYLFTCARQYTASRDAGGALALGLGRFRRPFLSFQERALSEAW